MQFDPSNTNETRLDKRGSVNTLSQMTNPFRTKIYNKEPSQQQTLMLSQSDMAQTRGQYNNQGMGPL